MPNRDQTATAPPAREDPPSRALADGPRRDVLASDVAILVRPLWIVGLALAIFAADLWAPLTAGACIAYIAVVLASLWAPRMRYTWIVAGLCTLLTGARLALMHGAVSWPMVSERGLTVLAIWAVAILSVWQRRTTVAQLRASGAAARAQEVNAALKAALARTEAAEAQLRRGQRLLDTVATMARIGGWEIDLATLEPIWSQEVYRIHGLDPSTRLDLAGMLEFYPPEARPLIERAIQDAIRLGASFDHTVPFITASGARRWVRVIGVPEHTGGVTTRLSGAFQDVTDQHEIQVRLARASRSSSEGHWDYDFGTETVWCSATHEELLGLAARDTRMPAEEFRARAHPDDQDKIAAAFRQHIVDGTPFNVELRMRAEGGEWRWFRTRGAVERDELGRLASFAGSLIDIHEERLAQDELRQVRARLERAIQGTQDGLWEWNIAEDTLWMSPRYCELLGYLAGEIAETPAGMTSRIHPDDIERIDGVMQDHFYRDKPYDVELRMRVRDGSYRWFRIRGTVERDESGRPMTLSGSTQDITPRKTAEAARIEAEQRLERAIRGSSDGFFEYDVAAKRMWYSPRVREMLEYDQAEPFPALLADLMPPEDRAIADEAVRRHFDENAPHDVVYRLPTRRGEWRWFRARGRCERDGAGRPTRFSGSMQDITTQREAEA
ncbi:MAG: PAS domain-containing protein, partial [Steroidobacteraceae bacterium]